MSKIQVTIVSSGHNVADARLHRLSNFLTSRGYQVSILAPGSLADAPANTNFQSIGGKSIGGKAGLAQRLVRNFTIGWKIGWKIKGKKVYCLAPDLTPILYLITKIKKQDLWVDLYEDYGKVLADRNWSKGFFGPIKQGLSRALISRTLKIATKVELTTVADQQVPPTAARNRIVFRNYPTLELAPSPYLRVENNLLIRNEVSVKFTDTPRAIYIGDIRTSRGLWDMLELAVAAPEWRFEFIGSVAKNEEAALADWLAANQKILADGKEKIIFHGRLAPAKSWEISRGAWVGLSLLHSTPAFSEAVPSKVYEYAFMGIPVLATPLPRVAMMLSDGGFGYTGVSQAQLLENLAKLAQLKNDLANQALWWICQTINSDPGQAELTRWLRKNLK
jgi:glycosyltransferase involved in cell wall biosynthesis